MGFVQEFREFAVKGNVVDMAVGIIIGVAFNKIVQSVVNDLIMPPIGLLIGGTNFKDLKLLLKEARPATETSPELPAVTINYGNFVNTCIEFVIIAFSCFVVVKAMNRVIRLRERETAAS